MVFFDSKGKERVLKDLSDLYVAKMVPIPASISDNGAVFPVEFLQWHSNEKNIRSVVDCIRHFGQ